MVLNNLKTEAEYKEYISLYYPYSHININKII